MFIIDADKCHHEIKIGYQGEDKARTIRFDLTAFIESAGAGSAYLVVKRPEENTEHVVPLKQYENYADWVVESVYVEKRGVGVAQLIYHSEDNSKTKTDTYSLIIGEGLGTNPAGDADKPMFDRMIEYKEAAETASKEALKSAEDASLVKSKMETTLEETTKSLSQIVSDVETHANNASAYEKSASENADKSKLSADAAEASKNAAADIAVKAENIALNPPKIQDGTWWCYNPETKLYVDSGISVKPHLFTPAVNAVNGGYQITYTNDAGLPNPDAVVVKDGITPVKGKDYWTAEDKREVINEAKKDLGKADVYKLIETITVDVDALVTRNAEPDQTPYNFKAVMVKVELPDKDIPTVDIAFKNANTTICRLKAVGATSAERFGTAVVKEDTGYWAGKLYGLGTSTITSGGLCYTGGTYYDNQMLVTTYPTINTIKFQNILKAGTKIEIWGVK